MNILKGNKKRKNSPSRNPADPFSQALKIILLGCSFLVLLTLFEQINLAGLFPIRTVRVYGIYREDPNVVKSALVPLVDHGFFAINVEYIRDRLLHLPWISELYVRRIWPDQVEITVLEKKPIARWNNESLLSDNGEVFEANSVTNLSLPLFVGPAGQQIFMLKYFNDINRLLMPLHAKISYLELTPYLSWKMRLTNGIIMQIGHKDILTRLDHFVKVYPKIVGARALDVDYIDLRYPNGLAIRWKNTANA